MPVLCFTINNMKPPVSVSWICEYLKGKCFFYFYDWFNKEVFYNMNTFSSLQFLFMRIVFYALVGFGITIAVVSIMLFFSCMYITLKQVFKRPLL